MKFNTVIHNFSGVYKTQSFMQQLKEAFWLDCSNISGTDCYCDNEAENALKNLIEKCGNSLNGIHFLDNGNYHYLTKLWTNYINENFDLIVFDNHPDMQQPIFSELLSCGGWLKIVLEQNVYVGNVLIIGVADKLITDEILHTKKLSIIAKNNLHNLQKNLCTFLEQKKDKPIYISIDKDVLNKTDAVTNWDNGSLALNELLKSIDIICKKRRIIGVDICGECELNFNDNKDNEINSKANELIYKKFADYFVGQN